MLVLLSCDAERLARPYSRVINSIQLLGQQRFLRGAAMCVVACSQSVSSSSPSSASSSAAAAVVAAPSLSSSWLSPTPL